MEQQVDLLWSWVVRWPDLLTGLLLSLGLPLDSLHVSWTVIQMALLVLAFSLALVAGRLTTPPLEERIRAVKLGPKLLRTAAVILRRLTVLYFALFLWFAVLAMRAATWGSRSYFLTLMATLVTAWVTISISSRVIQNRTLARLVEVGGWVLVTLSLLGILPEAMTLLDSIAIDLNEFHLSLLTLIQGIVVLSLLIWAASVLSRLVDRQLGAMEDFTPTIKVLIGKIARFGLIIVAVMIGLYAIGIDFTALTLISGAVGVGLGFGLQKVVSNLVSGIILLLDKSIKPGDVITVGETFGWITSLNARYVSVSMRDGREILIPNEDLITQQVQNWSFNDPYVRIEIKFGVSYDSDPRLVRRIASEAAAAHPRVVTKTGDYQVACHVTAFGDSSIDFVLRFFIADPTQGITNVRGDVFLALWDTFKEHDISIPYPHREIIMQPEKPKPQKPVAGKL